MLPPDRSTGYLPVMLIGQDNEAGLHSPSLRGSLFLPMNQTEKEGIRYFCADQFVPRCQALIHSIQERSLGIRDTYLHTLVPDWPKISGSSLEQNKR